MVDTKYWNRNVRANTTDQNQTVQYFPFCQHFCGKLDDRQSVKVKSPLFIFSMATAAEMVSGSILRSHGRVYLNKRKVLYCGE